MHRFKKWFFSLIKNYKQHEKIKLDLADVKVDLNNTKLDLADVKVDLNNTKLDLADVKVDLNNTKLDLADVKKKYYHILDFHLRKITPQAFLEIIEIHVSESCNLNCFGCNHFSQIAEKKFPDIEKFQQDMKELSNITKGLIGTFRLMGGEPLLNPQCQEFINITRKYFPDSSIWLVTNGILLHKQTDDFWECCKKNHVEIRPTKYPLKIDWEIIERLCYQYDIPLIFFNNGEAEKISWKFTLDPLGKCDNYYSFTNCSMANHCVQFKDGKLFTCPISAHIEHFNKKFSNEITKVELKLSEFDYIDIYKVSNYQEILSFLAKPIPFCRYCNVKKWKEMGLWRKSSYQIDEYIDLNGD
ncbi:radical SAM protein [Campylobacter sp. 2018MI35]|uniref:radical SAM protein n=1 Tax=Campylobacter molothri TaxID=1032242 RepID=UPI0019063BBC|nr:radical SAM protein [Campylobacter sp. 2018MI35]MBK2001097.1 radical SAM protein [Campylobacter sp. 2018MI35]